MNTREVAELIAHVKVVWPHTTWDVPAPVVIQVWSDLLADLPADATRATLLDLSGERFAPSPGVLRKAVLDRIQPDTTPGVDEAWAEVRRGIAAWGWPNPPCEHQWSHPAVADAVKAFGWRELCESENPDAARAHFARYFTSATTRHRPQRAPAAVLGALESARVEQVERLSEAFALPEGES